MKICRLCFFLILIFFSMSVYSQAVSKIKKVLLVVAMQQEAQPIINRLKLTPVKMPVNLPMRAYQGQYQGLTIALILNGQDPVLHVDNIGSQAAALTTYVGIEQFHPDLVISVGTAAGRAVKHTKAGDIFASKKICFYHRRMEGSPFYHYGIGNYPSFRFVLPKGMQRGIVCTGDATDQSAKDIQSYAKLNCDVIEMEAASVAWVSRLQNIPMFALKGITNNVEDKDAEEKFNANLSKVSSELAENVLIVLQTLSSKNSE